VVVGVDAELSFDDDMGHRIISQWREVSADEKHQLRDKFDEVLRPLGLQTRLVVVERDTNGLWHLYFTCMTSSALEGLRDQWRRQQLRDIVQSLFTCLSGASQTVDVMSLRWSLTDYERRLLFFSDEQG